MYKNNLEAVVNGEGYSLAIGNGSMMQAVTRLDFLKDSKQGREYWTKETQISYCWLRPHEGPGNPHTTVQKDL